ncbi:MAG: flagellar hook-associated protein FlgK [Acidimicrobiales bacterium]
MGGFDALGIAASGLAAHRRRIDVISENIVNANTPGYHRQRVELSAIADSSLGVFSGRNETGGGVTYDQVSRLRDATLTAHARHQSTVASERALRLSVLERVEDVIGGFDEGGLHDQINALFNSFDELASSPDDMAIRQIVLQRADALAQGFGRTTAALGQLRDRAEADIEDAVRTINALTEQIATLDAEILGSVNSNADPNTLLDQRDRKVRELAQLADVDVAEQANGQVSVTLDGELLVHNGRSTALAVEISTDPALSPLGYLKVAVATAGGRELRVGGGSLGGNLEAAATLVPDERRAIDALAAAIADQVNTQHRAGAGLDGTAGRDLFVIVPGSGQLEVSPDLIDSPEKVAAAEHGAGTLDESNARILAELGESPTGPAGLFAELVGKLGARVTTVRSASEASQAASAQADALAQSAGGVSLDEELTDLLSSQRAYEASARLITAIDEMLQTLINTGLVGR